MEFKQILVEDILSEATVPQLVRRWNTLTDQQISKMIVFDTDPATGKPTKQPLPAKEVRDRLVKAGVKPDDPRMAKVLKAAEQGYRQATGETEQEYAAATERERRQQMAKIKGGPVRKGREKYYRERGVY